MTNDYSPSSILKKLFQNLYFIEKEASLVLGFTPIAGSLRQLKRVPLMKMLALCGDDPVKERRKRDGFIN